MNKAGISKDPLILKDSTKQIKTFLILLPFLLVGFCVYSFYIGPRSIIPLTILWLAILWLAIILLKNIFSSEPKIIIQEDGIWTKATGLVYWKDIEGYSTYTIWEEGKQLFVILRIRNWELPYSCSIILSNDQQEENLKGKILEHSGLTPTE